MNTRPFRVGLTGGIASGKSTVARLFQALGAPVVDADEIAHEIVAPGQPLLAQIAAALGADILSSDGSLDRPKLRDRVFKDSDARATLEALTHPAIRARMEHRAGGAKTPYVLLAIPLLVEKNLQEIVDRVLVVDCDEAQQIRRLQARDGATLEQAQAILSAQAQRGTRLQAADDVILNTGDLHALRDQVAGLHSRYLGLGGQRTPPLRMPPP